MNESFRRPFAAGFAVWLASVPAFAQTPSGPAPAPTPPAPAATPPAPGTPSAVPAAPPRRSLSVEQVVSQALRQNPNRSVAELSRDQARAGVTAEEGRYPFVLAGDAGYTRVTSPRLGPDDTISSNTSRSVTLGAALRRTFPIGTTAELRLQGERFDDNLDASSFAGNSSGGGYALTARASVAQPLLRGAGTRIGELELRSARVQRDAADKQLRRVASETVRDSLLRYWELWFAEAQIEIERGALELAREQEREASIKVQQGALALADSFSFQTRVAELEESLVSAETARNQRALELATAIGGVDGDAATLSASSELPEPAPLGSAKVIEAALARDSVELAELESNWRAASVRAEAAGESSRPRLDIEGYVQSQGLGEKISSAAERAAGMSYLAVHVGLSGELPLDGTRYRAERESALLAVRIAEQNLKGARIRLSAEARAALESEASAVRRLELAQRTLEIAQRSYDAESARFELGQTIPIQVRQAEDELRRARLRVTRARVDVIEEQVLIAHLSGKLAELYKLGG